MLIIYNLVPLLSTLKPVCVRHFLSQREEKEEKEDWN